MHTMRKVRRFVAIAAALMVAATACGAEPEPVLAGFERTPDPTVGTFSLPAVNRGGDDFHFQADDGELLMVYFAFTNCPDFCPTTLADTRLALNELGPRAEDIDVAVVTIDPARDSAEAISDYVEAFIPDGIALRTDDEFLLRETTFAFGADFLIDTDDNGEIQVGHTTNLFAVDDTGSLILTWPFGVTTDDFVNDMNILLDRFEARA